MMGKARRPKGVQGAQFGRLYEELLRENCTDEENVKDNYKRYSKQLNAIKHN